MQVNWLGDPATRYILAQIPDTNSEACPRSMPMGSFIVNRRQYVLQYEPHSGAGAVEMCSLSWWDFEDHLFSTWGNPSWDWCLFRITGDFQPDKVEFPIHLDDVVIVLGWRRLDHTPQFAILDYSKRKELIHEIRAKLLERIPIMQLTSSLCCVERALLGHRQ